MPMAHAHTGNVHTAVAAAAVSTPQAINPPELTQPVSAPAIPYGNSRFEHALDDAQSTGLPQLPGANAISTVPGLVVVPPPSLKDRVHALGRTLYCKNAIFKRRMTDQELLKRGLTHRQMDQTFMAYCTP